MMKPRTLSRREALAAGAVGLLAAGRSGLAAAPAPSPRAAPYLEDARTARAVQLSVPRSSLRETLLALSSVAGFELTATPALAEERLVGYVPRRALRETMQALETLFEARWTRVPGMGGGYLLSPDPVRARAESEQQAAALKRMRARLDALAVQAQKQAAVGNPPEDTLSPPTTPVPVLWQHLTPPDRDRVLRGASVTISIPIERIGPLNVWMVNSSRREPAPLTEPLLATYDLDYDLDFPEGRGALALRARATGRRENSLIAIIGIQELSRLGQPARPAQVEEMPAGEQFPPKVGGTGRFFGGRDEVLARLAEACGVPILSRHRPQKQTANITAGGRSLSTVLTDLSTLYDVTPTLTSRGFCLLRDAGVVPEISLRPLATVVAEYLKGRPPVGSVVTLAQMSPLGALIPGQLAVLAQSSQCSAEARFLTGTTSGGDASPQVGAYAIVRFYASLSPEQRVALASTEGLDMAALTHRQLHTLIDARGKRGDFDLFPHLNEIREMRLRFRERPEQKEDNLILQAMRGGMTEAGVTLNLPVVVELPKPTAAV